MGGPAYGPQVFDRYNAVVQGDHTFLPTLMGTIRSSFARLSNQRTPASLGFDMSSLGLPSQLGAAIGPPASFPVVTITGISTNGSVANQADSHALGLSGEIAGYLYTYALQGNLIKLLGKHEFNMGTDLRLMQSNILQTSDNGTNFAFTAAFTQGPNANQSSSTAGDALASFLLGTPASASVSPVIALALESKYYAIYLQDDWKLKNSLTLNLGFRYEYETPFTERYNRLANFNPYASVPLTGMAGLHGALTFPGVNGLSRYDSTAYADHFEPRLGFAWHLLPKTVMHGGGGLFYSTLWGAEGENPSNYGISGFTAATSMVTSLDGVTPYDTLSNPYPTGLNAATGSSLGNATLLGQSITAAPRNLKAPYAVQWNLGFQQQFATNWSLDLTYVGTEGHHEPNSLTLDQLPDSDLALGSALNTLVTNPFYGQITTGALAAAKVSQAQLLRPYPQFTGVTAANQNWGASRFNALETTLQKRVGAGLNLLVEYTWSKMLDQGSGTFNGESLGGGANGVQDNYNLRAEMSTSSLDQTHRAVGSVVYQLPFYSTQSGVDGRILGGWTISALASFISGDPLGVTSSTNTTDSQGGGQRPNWNGKNPSLRDHTTTKWFDTSDFSAPSAYQFGNTPRTFNFLRSDWVRNIDVSLQKNVRVRDKLMLQIRADAFNMDNTPTF